MGIMMKIAVIRGGNLNKWDICAFEKLSEFEDVTVIGSKKSRYLIENIKINKILLFRFGILTEWAGYFSTLLDYVFNMNNYLFGLKKVIKDFDIVEASDTTYPFTYQAVKSHPLVVCNNYENIPFFREFGIPGYMKKIVRKKAAHFIAVTEKAKSVLELEGVASSKISVIPPGIDIETFRPRPKDKKLMKQYNISPNDVNVLFVGRIVYDKGIEDLVYAFKLLCDKHKNVNLLILGKGKWKNKIVKLFRHYGIESKVRFLGFLPYEETEKFYNLADIFCTPPRITKYWQEQFGFVYVEAMACGLPVVSTHAGSIPEVTGGNALLVSPGNHLELFDALDKLVNNPELRKKLGNKGREFAIKKYDSKIIAEKRLALYKKLLEK